MKVNLGQTLQERKDSASTEQICLIQEGKDLVTSKKVLKSHCSDYKLLGRYRSSTVS